MNQQQIYNHLEEIAIEKDPWQKGAGYLARSSQNLLDLIKQVPHTSILEVGCAQGDFTKELAKIADEVVAIDVSESEIKRAKKNCTAKNVTFLTTCLEDAYAKHPFDVIVCSEVLYYILDRQNALHILQQLGKYLVTSHFIVYGSDISFGSIKYEWDLRRFNLVNRIIEKSLKERYLVVKSLRKL